MSLWENAKPGLPFQVFINSCLTEDQKIGIVLSCCFGNQPDHTHLTASLKVFVQQMKHVRSLADSLFQDILPLLLSKPHLNSTRYQQINTTPTTGTESFKYNSLVLVYIFYIFMCRCCLCLRRLSQDFLLLLADFAISCVKFKLILHINIVSKRMHVQYILEVVKMPFQMVVMMLFTGEKKRPASPKCMDSALAK